MNLTLRSADELREYLNDLNWNGTSASGVAIAVGDILWLAYCTDPDGEWFFESGDPEDRMTEDAEGWREYTRVGFDWVGPAVDRCGVEILWPRATAEQLAQAQVDRLYPPHPTTSGWSYEDAAKYEGVREGLLEGLLAPIPEDVSRAQIECPHWSPGRITIRRGCTACASEGQKR